MIEARLGRVITKLKQIFNDDKKSEWQRPGRGEYAIVVFEIENLISLFHEMTFVNIDVFLYGLFLDFAKWLFFKVTQEDLFMWVEQFFLVIIKYVIILDIVTFFSDVKKEPKYLLDLLLRL